MRVPPRTWLIGATSLFGACTHERDNALDAALPEHDASVMCAVPSFVKGAEDGHCRTDSERVLKQQVSACAPRGNEPAIPDAPLLFNGRGADADCKYDMELISESCRTVLRVRESASPVEGAKARAELRDVQGALVFDAAALELGAGAYAWQLPAVAGVLHVYLFEQCAYADESSPRAQAAFRVSP